MGPILYTMYAAPIADIIRKHGLKYHIYADDTQIYIFLHMDPMENAISHLEVCVSEIRTWMKLNVLKLSDNKMKPLCVTREGFRTMHACSCFCDHWRLLYPTSQAGPQPGCHVWWAYDYEGPGQCRMQSWSFPFEEPRHHQEVSLGGRGCMLSTCFHIITSGPGWCFPSTRSNDFRDYRTWRPVLSLELRSRPA